MVKPRRNNRRPQALKSDSSSYSTHHEEEEEEERKPQPFRQAAETGASIVHPRQAQRQSGQTTEEAVALQNKGWEGCAAQLGTGLGISDLGLIPRHIVDWCGAFSDYTTKIVIPCCLLFLRRQFLDSIGPEITFSLSTKWR